MVFHLTHSPMPLHIHMVLGINTPPHSLKDSNASPKVKTTKGVRVHSLACNTSELKGHVRVLGWGLGQMTSTSIIHTNLHKPTISWLVRGCTFLVHGQVMGIHMFIRLTTTRNWRKPPPSPLYYSQCLARRPAPKCHFVLGLPSWKSWNSRNWDSRNFGGL